MHSSSSGRTRNVRPAVNIRLQLHKWRFLGEERFTAAAGFLHVGVVEDELGAEPIFLPVHFRTDDAEKGFAVDEHFDAVLLYTLVKLGRLFWLDVFQMVRHSGAAFVLDTHTDEFGTCVRL